MLITELPETRFEYGCCEPIIEVPPLEVSRRLLPLRCKKSCSKTGDGLPLERAPREGALGGGPVGGASILGTVRDRRIEFPRSTSGQRSPSAEAYDDIELALGGRPPRELLLPSMEGSEGADVGSDTSVGEGVRAPYAEEDRCSKGGLQPSSCAVPLAQVLPSSVMSAAVVPRIVPFTTGLREFLGGGGREGVCLSRSRVADPCAPLPILFHSAEEATDCPLVPEGFPRTVSSEYCREEIGVPIPI